MQNFTNIPENFIRELKGILVFDKSKISYLHQLAGKFPNPEEALYKYCVLPGDASRSIATNNTAGNISYSPDISVSLVDLTVANREHWYEELNRFNKFAVILISNTEMMMLGNDRFPLSITVSDAISDDGSGSDSFTLRVFGETIIEPKVYKIVPKFKVLFFIPPIL
ncbi:hypothetical protein [Chryseobacterium sp. 2R14A]|uniref:hypothetical protein n=1 Tax=Chryseobacterium sp. 2R14A TaxID=3380353 RepID=UPI003CEDC8E5